MNDKDDDKGVSPDEASLCAFSQAESHVYTDRDERRLVALDLCPLDLPRRCASICPCKQVARVDTNRAEYPVCVSLCLFPLTSTGQRVRSARALGSWVKKQAAGGVEPS